MKPTIGRTVVYKTTEADRNLMKAKGDTDGRCNVQQELPAVVVAVWSEECVNLKVNLDGDGEIWKTSINQGDEEGHWSWPARV